MQLLVLATILVGAFGVGAFAGYLIGYDQADRDNNDGQSTRVPFPFNK